MQSAKVLWIEDDPQVVESIKPGFASFGYSVQTTKTMRTVMREIRRGVSIVFLDIVLVGYKEGYWERLFEAIRKANPTIPVAVVTAWREEYKKQITRVNPDAVFDKPIPRLDSKKFKTIKVLMDELTKPDWFFFKIETQIQQMARSATARPRATLSTANAIAAQAANIIQVFHKKQSFEEVHRLAGLVSRAYRTAAEARKAHRMRDHILAYSLYWDLYADYARTERSNTADSND